MLRIPREVLKQVVSQGQLGDVGMFPSTEYFQNSVTLLGQAFKRLQITEVDYGKRAHFVLLQESLKIAILIDVAVGNRGYRESFCCYNHWLNRAISSRTWK